ncbi:LOW QUALITY PROTEIN: hypothetical protein HID58_061414, partial [Brassica napus]
GSKKGKSRFGLLISVFFLLRARRRRKNRHRFAVDVHAQILILSFIPITPHQSVLSLIAQIEILSVHVKRRNPLCACPLGDSPNRNPLGA